MVRSVAIGGPLAASICVAWALSKWLPAPESLFAAAVRWLAIASVSTLVLIGSNRVFRRLLPLAALLGLTLSFPDTAPSRFRIALRSGSTRLLRQRIADANEGRLVGTPADAAVIVLELVAALSLHDRLTRGHSERVRAYTQLIGEEMGLSGLELDRLRWAGLLHDIGKLRIPTEILNKPGRLTFEEFETVKTHPEEGRAIIEPLIPWLGDAAHAVWEHHERWDGTGYPRGLAGGDIARSARIVSVADSFDVMTSVRSYQRPMSTREARAELARCAGTQFDPTAVRAFLSVSLWPIGRITGPISWLAQASFFPTGVFTAGSAPGLAATAVLGAAAATIGTVPFEHATPVRAEEIQINEDVDAGPQRNTTVEPTSTVGTAGPANTITVIDPSGSTTTGGVDTTAAPTATAPGDGPAVVTTTPSAVTTTATITGTTTTIATVVVSTVPVTAPTPSPTTLPLTVPTTLPTTTVTVPPVTEPSITLPPVTLPPVTLPPGTLPLVTNPPDPLVTLPPVTVPPITVPSLPAPPLGGGLL